MTPTKSEVLYPPETVRRLPPKNIKEEYRHLFEHEYLLELSECRSYLYHDVFVTGAGIAYTRCVSSQRGSKGIHAVPACVSEPRISVKLRINMLAQALFFPTEQRIEQAIFITDTNSHGYFHWMTDVLPKLPSALPLVSQGYVVLLPEKYASPVATQSLYALGIAKGQIVIVPSRKKVKVHTLWTMDHLALPYRTGNYRPKCLVTARDSIRKGSMCAPLAAEGEVLQQKLAAQHVAHTNISLTKKVYVSRANAKYRRILNEEEVVAHLKKKGIATIHAEVLSFKEQIALFSSVELLIGLHGAGLTNMMWMSPRSKIVEIRNPSDAQNNCYFSLAALFDLEYYFSFAHTDSLHTHTADFLWNIEEIDKMLDELGLA